MEFHLLPILAFLCLALTSHAVLPSEVYWNSMLPNTPMPKSIRDVLRPDLVEDKSSSVDVGKGGVNVDAGQGKPGGGTNVGVGKGGVSYAATEDQLHADPSVALFFMEKDMRPGTKMNLHFIKNTKESVRRLELKVRKSIVQLH
ncbi:unnamed protein product, partial [Vitis vinifera]